MIRNLQGIHETVDYKAATQICLYYNEESENYPPHWHPSFEVIMPVINDYRVVCGHNDYLIKEGEILVICPCILHELFAPATGERIIFQPGLNHIKLKELDLITPLLSPAILVTKEEYPQVYEHIHRLMLEIKDEYMNFTTYSEISIIEKFLDKALEVDRELKAQGIRSTADSRNEKIGYKIREAQMEKIPYMLIIGEKEVQENVVSVRSRKDGVLGSMSLETFLEKALTEIREKTK